AFVACRTAVARKPFFFFSRLEGKTRVDDPHPSPPDQPNHSPFTK
uniref:Uncharacterized protein n=1 Tax=Aegilops tauschii subsp. strangulata TaxID=200361 RepID=A0A452XV07_AEGTS